MYIYTNYNFNEFDSQWLPHSGGSVTDLGKLSQCTYFVIDQCLASQAH